MYAEMTERRFFSRVFLNMTWALVLTGLVAYGVASYPPFARAVLNNWELLIILMVLEVILVMVLSGRIMRMSMGAAVTGFIVYALVNGVTLSFIFMAYTLSSIFTVFFIAAGLFLLMALFGYVTKVDLSPMGRFLLMALFGLILASLVNLFLRSEGLMYLYSIAGVLIFAALTAYDTQFLKKAFNEAGQNPEVLDRIAIIGALKLYLDLINLFLRLLRIFGKRR